MSSIGARLRRIMKDHRQTVHGIIFILLLTLPVILYQSMQNQAYILSLFLIAVICLLMVLIILTA